MRRAKRITALAVAAAMVFSNVAYAAPGTDTTTTQAGAESAESLNSQSDASGGIEGRHLIRREMAQILQRRLNSRLKRRKLTRRIPRQMQAVRLRLRRHRRRQQKKKRQKTKLLPKLRARIHRPRRLHLRRRKLRKLKKSRKLPRPKKRRSSTISLSRRRKNTVRLPIWTATKWLTAKL